MNTVSGLIAGLLLCAGMASVHAQPAASQQQVAAPSAMAPEADTTAIEPQAAEQAPAALPAADQETAADSKRPDRNAIRCEYITPLGTRFRKKFCGTEEQWARLQRGAKDVMRKVETQVNPSSFPGG